MEEKNKLAMWAQQLTELKDDLEAKVDKVNNLSESYQEEIVKFRIEKR